jgi:bifunctional isochorismate lyase/aryl carrier protein
MDVSESDKRARHLALQSQSSTKHHRSRYHHFSADGACLLIIDMQRFFIDPLSHASFPQAEHIVGNVQSLLESFRSLGLPIIFTRHGYLNDESPGIMGRWWGDVLRIDDPFSSIDDRLRPLEGERVVRKTRYSAFVGTGLENTLEELGVTRLVITGVLTHLCCESTARDAFMRDHEVFLVVDGTASDEDELHLGSLRGLADGFAMLVTTEDLIAWLVTGK